MADSEELSQTNINDTVQVESADSDDSDQQIPGRENEVNQSVFDFGSFATP